MSQYPPNYGYNQPPPPGMYPPPQQPQPYYPAPGGQPPYPGGQPPYPGGQPQVCQPGGYYPQQPQTIVVQDKPKKEDTCLRDCLLCGICTTLCCWCCTD